MMITCIEVNEINMKHIISRCISSDIKKNKISIFNTVDEVNEYLKKRNIFVPDDLLLDFVSIYHFEKNKVIKSIVATYGPPSTN